MSARIPTERRPAGPAPAIPASGPGPETRKAALLLHGLSEPDRAWLLAQLPAPQRALLERLLEELQALGIPADGELVAEAVARSAPAAAGRAGSPADGPEQRIAELERASPARLVKLLSGEPPGVVARLLQLREWPWRAELLRQLGSERADRVRALQAAMGPGASPAALAGRLVERVVERLREGEGAAGEGAGRGWRMWGAARGGAGRP